MTKLFTADQNNTDAPTLVLDALLSGETPKPRINHGRASAANLLAEINSSNILATRTSQVKRLIGDEKTSDLIKGMDQDSAINTLEAFIREKAPHILQGTTTTTQER